MSTKPAHLLLNPLVQQARIVKRLPRRYIGALVLLALLAAGGQLLIQTLLSQQADSGHVISLAANQETLSQRVSKDAMALAVFTDAKNRAFYFQEFTAVGASWNEVHLGLQHGDAKLNLPPNNDPVIAQDFQQIQPQYNAILQAYLDVEQFAQTYAQSHPDAPYGFAAAPLTPDVMAVMNAEEPFAQGMEKIVARMDALDTDHVTTVRIVEVSLFLATLLVLLMEGLFIFAPAFQTLRDNQRSLENSDRRWREYTTTLAQRNKQLEEAYEEAWQARSRTLLPVKLVGNQYMVAGRERLYRVTRGPSGAGLVCDCHAGELGYVCTHILSATHFQAAHQRAQQNTQAPTGTYDQRAQPNAPGANGTFEWNPGRSGIHSWMSSNPGAPVGKQQTGSHRTPNSSATGAPPEQGQSTGAFEWGRRAQEQRRATPPPDALSQPSTPEWLRSRTQ